MNSGIFKLDWRDLAKGLVVAVLTGILTYAQQVIAAGTLDFSRLSWSTIGGVAAAAAVGYLLKNLLSDDQGKFVGKVGCLLLLAPLALGGCALSDRGQAVADELGALSTRDIDQAIGLATLNNDQPALQCLAAIRYVVTSIQAYAAGQPDGKLVVGPLTAFQMGMDVTNPGGYLQTECAAQKAQVKSRVQLFLGQTATLLATFGL